MPVHYRNIKVFPDMAKTSADIAGATAAARQIQHALAQQERR
jgi:hypothetical protein